MVSAGLTLVGATVVDYRVFDFFSLSGLSAKTKNGR